MSSSKPGVSDFILLTWPFRLRGKVVLKGRRPDGAGDDYDTEEEAADDDQLTDIMSVKTDKATPSVSIIRTY